MKIEPSILLWTTVVKPTLPSEGPALMPWKQMNHMCLYLLLRVYLPFTQTCVRLIMKSSRERKTGTNILFHSSFSSVWRHTCINEKFHCNAYVILVLQSYSIKSSHLSNPEKCRRQMPGHIDFHVYVSKPS